MSHKSGIQTTRHRIFGLLWDRKIVAQVPNYLFQSALATASLIVILLVEDTVLRAAIVVAGASTAFTIFVVPNSVAASPRRVIGGHLVAVIAGTMFWSLEYPCTCVSL
jgi:CBS-domain-containing membrane protein